MKTVKNYKPSKTVIEEVNVYYMVGARRPELKEFIIIGMPEDSDGFFSSMGCSILNNGLGCTVYEVDVIVACYDKNGEYVELERHQEQVCHEVLDAYHNGTEIAIDEDNRPISE